ncbi:MAG: TrmH family RNA methyltransferase [Treponema sp.]|nr:TrmH family RNA methyltransferase [Treponema sp.]
MIPLYKLDKLPRTQRLRKIAKFFSFAENRLCMAVDKGIKIFSAAELVFFKEAAMLLEKDDLFNDDERKAFKEAALDFEQAVSANNAESFSITGKSLPKESLLSKKLNEHDLRANFHRALNSIRHILLAQTGRDQADWDFICGDGRLDPQKRQIFEGMHVYMEDIRSPFNVGAMFRTAESFGVEKIILSPLCADPRHKRAERTAMGCIDIITWERNDLFSLEDSSEILNRGFQSKLNCSLPIFALETGGVPLNEFPFPRRGILITGSEELGVSPRALAAADASLGRVTIPSYGTKASLNVSVAFGIAVQTWAQKNFEKC